MGCCQNKELHVVCSCDFPDEEKNRLVEEEIIATSVKGSEDELERRRSEHLSNVEGVGASNADAAEVSPDGVVAELEAAMASGRPPAEDGAPPPGTAGAGPGAAAKEAAQESVSPLLEELYLTGTFASWATDFKQTHMTQVASTTEGTAKLRMCLKLTSQSFSFQVVSAKREWNWRLYPRDAKNIRFTHASKEGRLKPNEPNAVIVGLGDLKAGHGLNFHVIEEAGVIATVWIEVPVTSTPSGLVVRTDTAAGARVWYTLEDTGVQYLGGDGVDLNKYAWMKIS